MSICLWRKIASGDPVSSTAFIQQSLWMNIPAQIVFFDDDVVSGPRRKSGVWPHREAGENNSPCLRFARLIIEAAIPGNFYICGAIHDVNPSSSLRLILISKVAARI